MKYSFLMIMTFLLSISSYADMNCYEQAKQDVLAVVADHLDVLPSDLQVRSIGGETLDGDIDQGNIYKDHLGEYFDVFLADEDVESAQAIALYGVGLYVYTNIDTDEVVECNVYQVESIPVDEWKDIYDIYL